MSAEAELRAEIVQVMRAMGERGLNKGTSGNVSARFERGMLVTPSGVTPDRLTPESIVFVDGDGAPRPGGWRPSSEWRMHLGLYTRRPDVNGVVHCHSRHATILACAGLQIPSMHYMVMVGGKSFVPLAPYSTYGTDELARDVAVALDGGYACLMANHGQITVAPDLAKALAIAEEIEEQAAVYWGALAIGGPKLLDADQMAAVLEQYKGYGQR